MVRQNNTINVEQDVQRVQNGKVIISLQIINGKIIKSELREEKE